MRPKLSDYNLTELDIKNHSLYKRRIEQLEKETSGCFLLIVLFLIFCWLFYQISFELGFHKDPAFIVILYLVPAILAQFVWLKISENTKKKKIAEVQSKLATIQKFLQAQREWENEERRKAKSAYIHTPQTKVKNTSNYCATYKKTSASLKKLIKSPGIQFERRIYNIFVSLGFDEVILTPPTDDGGIDVIAHRKGYKLAIQCKAHAKPSGPAPVRELYGVMCSEKFDFGLLINPSGFSSRAMEFAKGKNIILVDKEGLQKLLDRLPNNKKERDNA